MGPTVERVSDKARRYGMWVLAGTIKTTTDDDKRCSKIEYLINPAAVVTYFYNKVQMFDVRIENQVDFLESSAVRPGNEVGFKHINDAPVGIATYGRSMVIDPWGTVIACTPDGLNTTLVTIDDSGINEVRQNVPSLVNRQPAVYKLGF